MGDALNTTIQLSITLPVLHWEFPVVFFYDRDTQALPRSLHGGGESLGVWSAADVMWELSPGMRSIAGGVRPLSPSDVAGMFFDLVPAQRKVNYLQVWE